MTFDFSDGEEISGNWNGQYLLGDDNLPLGWDGITFTASYSLGSSLYGTETKPPVSNLAYSYVLLQIYLGQYETISIWYAPVFGIIMYILGIICFLYPEETYFLLSRWRYQNPELSESGILIQRIGAAAICLAGVVFMSGMLVLFV